MHLIFFVAVVSISSPVRRSFWFCVFSISLFFYKYTSYSTDPHLIAWFSAGAFVLLGFPISIYGIVMHLMNYNQPHVQCYVVRILWMVPIYSIESWLCLRYKNYAIYIETLRDCYESYVLYSFLQFLIEVLGGEDALILMLKDKSPTRGVHMWGLQYCGLKPWLMGQPVRRTYDSFPDNSNNANANPTAPLTNSIYPGGDANPDNNGTHDANASNLATSKRYKRVHWTSPFFVYCKFGVLQYVLLKLVCTFFVLILETFHIYKEGDFTYKGGYLYICTITNLSQCWALYCLIFFYYATKNELGPINPVGKFLAVKALVFFTWWQSLGIAILYQYNLIPYYSSGSSSFFGFGAGSSSNTFEDDPMSSGPLPLSEDAALALDELGGTSLSSLSSTLVGGATSSSGTTETEWTSEDVAKGLQDYLICIEMFVAAIVHVFVFSHTEFDPQAVEARERALHQQPFLQSGLYGNKRLGRKWKDSDNKSAYSGTTFSGNTSGNNNNGGGVNSGLEMVPIPTLNSDSNGESATSIHHLGGDDDLIHPLDRMEQQNNRLSTVADNDNEDEDGSYSSMSSSELNDDDWENNSNYGDNDEEDSEMQGLLASHKRSGHTASSSATNTKSVKRTGFVKALLDSAIPQDLRDNTVGIIKGDYVVERKTLLHHAATSDSYDLFSRVSSRPKLGKKNTVRNQLNMHRATTIGANNAPPTLQEQPRTGTAAGGDPNILLGGLAASSEYAIDKAVQDLA